jgi:hypothetical protein
MRSWPGLVLAVVLMACSDDDKPDAMTSKIEGTLALASFSSAPTGVDALDEAGIRSHSGIGPDGAFGLDLTKDHVYRLVVVGPQGETPVVFARSPAQLDRTFRLDDGNVVVSLGTIRLLPKAPDAGISVRTGAPTDPACVDGKVSGSEAACVEDIVPVTCAPGAAADPDDGDDDDDARPAETADPAQPFALPDRNAPKKISGCED